MVENLTFRFVSIFVDITQIAFGKTNQEECHFAHLSRIF